MNDARAQTAWALAFMNALREAGVRDIVLSPGSRSTPFVAAAARVGLDCTTIIDERAAGFFALGKVRASDTPVALLCTSGSAGCHYFPAIVEASHAFLPLIAITADRPPELHGCAAPQAMNQTRLFGDHVRTSIDLGTPCPGDDALRAVQRKAVQAVSMSLGPTPGPVHINAPARKPLEPVAGVDTPPSYGVRAHRAPGMVSEDGISALIAACERSRRGVIVAGPAPLNHRGLRDAVAALSRATGYPVLAEATSQLRLTGRGDSCDGFAPLLTSEAFASAHVPELIIQLGAPPAGWELTKFIARNPRVHRYVLTAHGWPDPTNTATALLIGDVGDAVERVTAGLADAPADTSWADAFNTGSELAWRCVESGLGSKRDQVGEDQVIAAVASNLPASTLLALGNSLPVRTIDWFCPARDDIDVCHQRGVNGIDGLIAGAAGAASARTSATVLVLGDVSFAHDVGGLATAQRLDTPLVIVVVDNAGGRIFDFLPVAQDAELSREYDRHWLAEQSIDVAAAAASYGHRAIAADSVDQVAEAVRDAVTRAGCTVIHARVEPTSAKRSKQAIAEAIDAAWTEVSR